MHECTDTDTHTYMYVCIHFQKDHTFYHVFDSPIPCFIITLLLVLSYVMNSFCDFRMLCTEIYFLEDGCEFRGWRDRAWEEGTGSRTRRSISFSKRAALFNSRGYMWVRISESGVHFGPGFLLSFHKVFLMNMTFECSRTLFFLYYPLPLPFKSITCFLSKYLWKQYL